MLDKILRSSDVGSYGAVGELAHFEMLRSRRYQRPLSIFSIVVPRADEAVANATVEHLREFIRRIDLVEVSGATSGATSGIILLICPETNANNASGLLKRLRVMPVLKDIPIGFAAFPDDGSSIDLLLETSRERALSSSSLDEHNSDGTSVTTRALDANLSV